MTEPVFDEAFREQLGALLTWRRDVRHFQSRPLPEGLLDRLIEAACHGPSVGNSQPWRLCASIRQSAAKRLRRRRMCKSVPPESDMARTGRIVMTV